MSNSFSFFRHHSGSLLCSHPMTPSVKCDSISRGIKTLGGANVRLALGNAIVRAGSFV